MAKVELPRYLRAKKLKVGIGYFWEPPHWARPPATRRARPCPVVATALGRDLARAIDVAEQLNAALDGWRNGEAREASIGTVAWLFKWYQGTAKFARASATTRADYRKLMSAIADLPMRQGTFGQRLATKVDATVADTLYEKFQARGRRQATYAMQVCRLVWNWALRYKKTTGISENPFAGMALSHAVADGNRPTTRPEYNLYRAKARELGYQSMATAAALAFELVQRVWDVFGIPDHGEPAAAGVPRGSRGIRWRDYEPGVAITVRQSKTGKRLTIPLTDEGEGEAVVLYPELEDELARSQKGEPDDLIVREERSGRAYKHRRMSSVHREICAAAGLPKSMTFTGFRHGGATEIGDSGEADIRPISGHTQLNTTAIYNKASEAKATRIALHRREHIHRINSRSTELSD
ncbi:MAG TPA: tyrosine-type recombinase/integrase [Allosphingosinicella sp.]